MTHLCRSQLPQGMFIHSSKTAFIDCIVSCHNIYILFIEVSANKCNENAFLPCLFSQLYSLSVFVVVISMSSFQLNSRGITTGGQNVVPRIVGT